MSSAFYVIMLAFLPVLQDQEMSVNLLKYNGITNLRNSNYDSAIYYFELAIEKDALLNDFKSIAESYNNIGIAYYYQDQFKQSIDNYLIALEYYDKTKNDTLIAESQHNMGLTYKRFGLYERAQESLILAARKFEELGLKKNLSSTLNSLGNIHRDLGNFDQALKYLNDALSLRRDIKYEFGIAQSLHNLGSFYFEQDSIDKAILFYSEAYDIKNKIGQDRSLANTLSRLGELYTLKNDFNRALIYLEGALKLRKKLNDFGGVGIVHSHLGALFLKNGNIGKSRAHLDSAKVRLEERGLLTDLAYNFDIKRQFFLTLGKYDSAYWYSNELARVKEQIINDEKAKVLIEAEIKYDVFRKESEIESQRQSLAILESRISLWITLFVFMTILVFVIVRLLRNSKRENSRVENLLREMNHRTQNHLESLAGIIELEQLAVQDISAKEVLRGMSDRTRAIALIHKSLYSSQEGNKEEIRLGEYIRNIGKNLVLVHDSNSEFIKVKYDVEPVDLDLHKALPVGIIFNELLTNSFKYGKGPDNELTVEVHLTTSGDKIMLKVSDHGSEGFQPEAEVNESSGRKIIGILVNQLKATWSEEYRNGLISQITFFK